MYRILPNPNLYIDNELNFYNNNNKITMTYNENGEVRVELYGNIYYKAPIWLYLLAKFKISLPRNNVNSINDIEFNKFGKCLGTNLEYSIQTKKPILYNKDYAIPLLEPTITISKNGHIINLDNGEPLTYVTDVKPWFTRYYKKIMVNGKYHLLHRLVLSAWVYNSDPTNLIIGNHIDGNKLNNDLTNLEWVSFKGNMVHAIKNGLRKDNIKVTIRHKDTKDIIQFHSLRELSNYLGRSSIYKYQIKNMRESDTINGYEIKLGHKEHSWYYQNGTEEHIPKSASFCYTITSETGVIEKFYNIKDIRNRYNFLPRTPLTRVKKYLSKMNYNIIVTTLKKDYTYEVYIKETNAHLKGLKLAEVINITNFNRVTINNMVRTEPVFIEGISIRKEDGDVWNIQSIRDLRIRRQRLEATNTLNGEVNIYESLRKFSIAIGVTTKTILKYVRENKLLFNYKIKYID